MNAKKSLAILGLIVLIAAAAIFCVKMTVPGSPKVPDAISGESIELIDTETLETMTKTRGEWDELAAGPGIYKNPQTGAATMVPTFACLSCGATIPHPKFATGAPDASAGNTMTGAEGQTIALPETVDASAMMKYKCPKCGQPAMQPRRR